MEFVALMQRHFVGSLGPQDHWCPDSCESFSFCINNLVPPKKPIVQKNLLKVFHEKIQAMESNFLGMRNSGRPSQVTYSTEKTKKKAIYKRLFLSLLLKFEPFQSLSALLLSLLNKERAVNNPQKLHNFSFF